MWPLRISPQLLLAILAAQSTLSFIFPASCRGKRSSNCPPRFQTFLAASFEKNQRKIESIQDVQNQVRRLELIKAKLQLSEDVVTLELLGKATLPTTSLGRNQTCFVLSPPTQQGKERLPESVPVPAMLVPTENSNQIRLVQAAAANEILSPVLLLRLNMMAVNRDNGLFDNLPWDTWTVDPSLRNRDAAGNPIDARFHLGKRDAYNVMMGKDWKGRSWALSNLAQRLRKQLEQTNTSKDTEEEESDQVLAKRMLELQIREAKMDLAECDYQLAISRTMDGTWALEEERELLSARVQSLEIQLQQLTTTSSPSILVNQVLESVENLSDGREMAPYRGATGYAPMKDNGDDKVVYTSPYHMLREILENQLKAEVIGTLLENTSLLGGTTALGGVLVLRRLTAKTTTTIAGETVSVPDETEDYGNNIAGGELAVVECDADEVFGISFAYGLPLQVEKGILERNSVMVQIKSLETSPRDLVEWETVDPELSILVEGQAGNQSATERVAPLRIPRSTSSIFDTILQPQQTRSRDLFPSDNPIQSLKQYDQLSNEDKVRTLMSMSNFEGRLPRPRVVRESTQNDVGMNPLDRLLLPRIDESVRREYYIRQAVKSGDMQLAQELESSKSMRQISKKKAEQARDAGEEEVADFWEKEAALYESLRADVTQDEGAYSRFLDRDEWYERERRKLAARVDRKKFGNLLDGIE